MMREDRIFEHMQLQVQIQLEQFAERIKERLRAQVQFVLRGNKKIATGTLWKSIDGEIEKKANEMIITVFSNTNYAELVHEGTRPHFPPVYKIRDWVRIKRLAGRYSKETTTRRSRRLGNRMDQYWEDTELAYKIAWKIYRKGTKGLKFFDIALKQLTPWIERECSNWNPKL